MAERLQCVARGLVSQLGLVAQREQRLGATCGRTGARDGEYLVVLGASGARFATIRLILPAISLIFTDTAAFAVMPTVLR